jgi:hypothetical protein
MHAEVSIPLLSQDQHYLLLSRRKSEDGIYFQDRAGSEAFEASNSIRDLFGSRDVIARASHGLQRLGSISTPVLLNAECI